MGEGRRAGVLEDAPEEKKERRIVTPFGSIGGWVGIGESLYFVPFEEERKHREICAQARRERKGKGNSHPEQW